MIPYLFKRTLLAAVALLTIVGSLPGLAQETTSAIRGLISGPQGKPIKEATVTIVHQPTNKRVETKTNDNGRFSAKGLKVGGPYLVTISSSKGKRRVEDLYLTLGDTFSLDLAVGNLSLEEVTVVAKQLVKQVAVGPSSTFGLEDLQGAPAINRDIKDLLRADPRIYIDEAGNDEVQCGGANPRFNSLTVDGVRMNDNFGLNGNGYPTERIPFSYDAIRQIAIELAPFDVQYGGFSACNINAVTKSGNNELHGSFFFDFTNEDLSGDSLEGERIDIGDFEEKRLGLTAGGPIFSDKLFYFIAAEKLEGVQRFARGPAGSGAAVEVAGVSQHDWQRIIDIARNTYHYEPGSLPPTLPVEDEKLLIKLDWNINDHHRASLTYNYNDGYSIAEADGDADELEFSNHYYERGAQLDSYVAHLFSDWSEHLSTELKIGYAELRARQLSLGGTEFGEVQIRTRYNDTPATVYLGADDSRHANQLSYDTANIKFTATYLLGSHTIFAGVEREQYDITNLFIQEAAGEYRFNSIDDFAAGLTSRITYENAALTNTISDAIQGFSYDINTVYIQDEYLFSQADITVVFGLRYDWYSSEDKPAFNQTIADVYGISNQQNLDGLDLLQPRFGFNWNVNDALEVHGGIGLYSGGNPNVWVSNNYSNDGVTQIESQSRNNPQSILEMPFTGQGRPIYDVPQFAFDDVAAGTARTTGVNLLDKNFEPPSSWKFALGGSYEFDNGYLLSADFLHTKNKDAAIISDISRVQIGTAPDGRAIYGSLANGRRSDFMLTNASGDSGSSNVLSLSLSKSFEFGLDMQLAYAYTSNKDVNPMTSSVAYSNYSKIAVTDPEDPGAATSNYEIKHRLTLRLYYERAFIANYLTKFSVIGATNQGRPYSYTFSNGFMFGDSTGNESRHLLYVPSGIDDPLVMFGDDFDTQAFFAFVDAENLQRGAIVKRNSLRSDWWTKFDVKIEQQLPGFNTEHRAAAFLVIENLGNLLNDDWGVLYETDFPRMQGAVTASIDAQSNRYLFTRFDRPAKQTRDAEASFWNVRLGLRYEF